MIKKLLFVITILLASQSNLHAQDVLSRIVGSSPFQDSLWVVDTTTMSITHRIMPTPSSGGSITGMNGIAKNPNTGLIYIINKQSGVSGRTLGTINVQTGLVTIIGNLGDNFASITFRGDSLFGVTGDGATVPETVYLINTTNASKTLYRTLGNGADGEVISYNSTDDMIYHWSGNSTIVYEKFSPVNAGDPVVGIPIIGTTNGETFGSVYIGNNNFLNSNIGSSFNHWNANGTVSAPSGYMPDDLRGLAFVTCTRQISGTNHFCVGGSTTLSVGTAISYQWYKNGVALSGESTSSYVVSSPGVYNCMIRDVCGMDSVSTGMVVQQNPLPSVSLSGSTTLCTGTPVTLTGTSGGTSQWYLNGALISGETSNTISVSAPGVYNMTKTNMNGCTDSSAVGLTVVEYALPVVTLDASSTTACMNDEAIVLTESPVGGTFIGSTGNQFDPSAATPGSNLVIYNYTDGNGCSSSDTVDIQVYSVTTATLDPVANMCVNETAVNLNGLPAGGTYLPSSVVDPSTLGSGVFDFSYIITDVNGCLDTAEVQVLINELPVVSVNSPSTDLCYYDSPVELSGSPMGGTFNGIGVVGSDFDPAAATIGDNVVDYIYTDGTTGCTDIASVTISVDSCLSVNESAIANISFYPNPASTEVKVDFGSESINAELVLFDMTGKRIYSSVLNDVSTSSVDVSRLENGSYWFVIATVDGQIRQKIVVLH